MKIREIAEGDLWNLFELYTQLRNNSIPVNSNDLLELWNSILRDKQHHIIIALEDNKIVSSCTLVIIPNLTHDQRSYTLIENVITDEFHREQGFASACLDCARHIAEQHHCYKIVLMAGSKQEPTLNFYRKAGYNSEDKTAFIQWL